MYRAKHAAPDGAVNLFNFASYKHFVPNGTKNKAINISSLRDEEFNFVGGFVSTETRICLRTKRKNKRRHHEH